MMPFDAFCDLIVNSLAGDKTEIKKQIGGAVALPHWGVDPFDLMVTAAAEANLRKRPTENTIKNLKGGKGDWNIAMAAYYWLHRNFPQSIRLESIDAIAFGDRTLREIAEAAGQPCSPRKAELTNQIPLQPPLMVACQGQDIEIVKRILENGADPNQSDPRQWTALMVASQHNCIEAIDLLAKHGAEIDKPNFRGWTAFHLACQEGNLEATTRLLKHGADINRGNDNGWTGLMVACQHKHTDLIDHLLQEGADIERRNVYGWSALMVASGCGYLETVEKLLLKQTRLDHTNMKGQTAKEIAAENGHVAVAQRLETEERRRSASQS